MHCLDCCMNSGDEHDAVAICHSCGAAVCERHASALPVYLTRIGVIMREERVEPPAREILCPTCLAARLAAEPQRRAVSHRRSEQRDDGLRPVSLPRVPGGTAGTRSA